MLSRQTKLLPEWFFSTQANSPWYSLLGSRELLQSLGFYRWLTKIRKLCNWKSSCNLHKLHSTNKWTDYLRGKEICSGPYTHSTVLKEISLKSILVQLRFFFSLLSSFFLLSFLLFFLSSSFPSIFLHFLNFWLINSLSLFSFIFSLSLLSLMPTSLSNKKRLVQHQSSN